MNLEQSRLEEFSCRMPDYDADLIGNVSPPTWKNPEPASRYNLVVVGAGTAGLVAAAGAAALGARVALVEKSRLGGDCLNYGCVPSKALIRASRAVWDAREARNFGVTGARNAAADFSAVMDRMRRLRAAISRNDSVARFSSLGVDVFLGEGRFTSASELEVEGSLLRFSKALIATGARAAIPDVPGLKEAGFLTNETVFDLRELPARLAIIGAGPIGCELAQAFSRFGSRVALLERGAQLLAREDRDAAEILQRAFSREGVDLRLNAGVVGIEKRGDKKEILLDFNGVRESIEVDEILVGAGRVPSTRGMNLEAAGVDYSTRGVIVDDHLRTTNRRIFASGDVCMRWKFTHAADFASRIVLQNALFFGRKKLSSLFMPWTTYTDPEIAHVGIYAREAESVGVEIDTLVRKFSDVDRAVLDGDTEGFAKVHLKRGTDRILGATIVSRHAGEMIGELALAISEGVGLKRVSNVIHPYPTQAEAIRQLGDAFNRRRLTPGLKKVFGAYFKWLP